MNYHIEHHMYPGIPNYNLPALHELIKQDLPPTPDGLLATWRQIFATQRRQRAEPDFYQPVALPEKVGESP